MDGTTGHQVANYGGNKQEGAQVVGGCRNWMHTSSFVQTGALDKMRDNN